MSIRAAFATLLVTVAACQPGSEGSAQRTPEFMADHAYEAARKMVSLGPRPSGSPAIAKTQQYIIGELKQYGLKIVEDDFTATTPKGQIPMKNIIGQLQGSKNDVVLITGHYDTKLQDGFVGANDGASSAATVLELARTLSKNKAEYSIWFVFFDGEEAVVDWNAMNGMDNTYGSRHFVEKALSDGSVKQFKAMILVDMIGDKQLNIKREGESTPWLVDLFWSAARNAGYGKFFVAEEQYISDDHLPFKDAGVPVIDLIDFDYGPRHSYWHTNDDTLDKISGESMKAVGDVIIRVLPELFKRLDHPAPADTRPKIPQ